jgi:hypothetical protein
MSKTLTSALLIAGCALSSSVARGVTMPTALSFSDNDMHPVDYMVLNKHNTLSISDSSFVNTEALRCTVSGQVYSVIFRKNPTWNPATLGSILTISLSADFFLTQQPVSFAPVLVQGQNVYAPPGVPPYYQEPANFNTPQGLSWSLPISLYGREMGTGPGVPDFSPGAMPIQFGIAARRDAGGATFYFGKVNFNISGAKEIPEPMSGLQLGLALAALTPFRATRRFRCRGA